MNLFQEIGASIAGVSRYPRFLGNKKGKVFWYGVLVVTLSFLVANVKVAIAAPSIRSSMEDAIEKYAPDFRLENGEFHIEEPFYYEDDDMLVDISDEKGVIASMTEGEWYNYLKDYDSAWIIDADGAVMKSNNQFQVMPWPDELTFSKETMISWLPVVFVGAAIWYAFSYFFGIGGYFFAALFVALVCLIISSAQGYKFTFGQIYLLSIYGKTLALFIKGVSRLIGIGSIPGLGALIGIGGFAISCVYVSLAMALIDRERKAQLQMQNQMNGYMY